EALGEAEGTVAEDAGRHRGERLAHRRNEVHRRDHVVERNARRDLDELRPALGEREDSTLGHVEDPLAARERLAGAPGDLVDGDDELPDRAVLLDPEPAVANVDVLALGGERAAEDNRLRGLGDVHEASGADQPVTELADVDVSLGVNLRERDDREVDAATVEKSNWL